MKIQVQFFGPLEKFTHYLSPEQRAMLPVVEIPDGTTISQLLEILRVTGAPGSIRPFVVVNKVYQRNDAVLHEGDQVELVPPMAGG